MSREQLELVLPTDFPGDQHDIGLSTMTWVFPDMPDFSLLLDIPYSLTVMGTGRYAGFMMFVSEELHWHCSVRDGRSYSATAGAKKLAQLMEGKFGVRDTTRLLADWGRGVG
jgi:hypothetical protein